MSYKRYPDLERDLEDHERELKRKRQWRAAIRLWVLGGVVIWLMCVLIALAQWLPPRWGDTLALVLVTPMFVGGMLAVLLGFTKMPLE